MDFGLSQDEAAKAFQIRNMGGEGTPFRFEDEASRNAPRDVAGILAEWELQSRDGLIADNLADQVRRHAPTLHAALLAQAIDRQAKPFPARETIKHLQVSLFDNWRGFGFRAPPGGRAGRAKGARKKRFVVTIEVWDSSFSYRSLTKYNRDWAASGALLTETELVSHLDTIPAFKRPDWQGQRDMMMEHASTCMIAPLYAAKGTQSRYLRDHFIVVPEADMVTAHSTDLTMILVSPVGAMKIAGFVGYDGSAAKAPLAGNVVLSSRLSTEPSSWTSTPEVTQFGKR